MANDPREGGVESMFNERKEEWSSKVGIWEGVGRRWHMKKDGPGSVMVSNTLKHKQYGTARSLRPP